MDKKQAKKQVNYNVIAGVISSLTKAKEPLFFANVAIDDLKLKYTNFKGEPNSDSLGLSTIYYFKNIGQDTALRKRTQK